MDAILAKATQTLPAIESDEVPPEAHQEAVRLVAEEWLESTSGGATTAARLKTLNGVFDSHPLLALEVIDEAFVVHKNEEISGAIRQHRWPTPPACS